MNLMTQAGLHNGEYILKTQLGTGMFEITYQATHAQSGETVVIKTLGETLRQHSEFDQFKQKFLELAARLKGCKHPNLVQVLDYFEEAGMPYLVMELIEGETVAQLIQTEVLPEPKALNWIRQIGGALSVLHKADLLHQDIKPENIRRRQDSESVVLCGVAITYELTAGVMPNHAILSAGYAPPEQYNFEAPRTKATDIYALAATLYYMLTGRPPLPATVRAVLHGSGSDGGASAKAAAQEEYRLFSSNLQQHQSQVSPAVKEAMWRGLALVAQRRPQTVEAWLSLFYKHKKVSTPELPSFAQRSSVKPPAQNPLKLNSSGNKTLQPSVEEKSPTFESPLAENLVTTFKIPPKETSSTPKKPKLPKTRSPKASAEPNTTTKRLLPLKALLVTGAIAASAGLGFGLALRLNSPSRAGSSLLHSEQSFPRTSNWPMSQPGS
jgi:serine/threonine-protein kinase